MTTTATYEMEVDKPCQNAAPTARETFASEKTAAGRAGTPRATIRTPASESSKMYWAKPRRRLRRSWYELYAQPNIRTATADRYRLMIETYTIPRIGKIKLKKLTSRDLQKLYKDLMEHGRVNHRSGHGDPGLSSTTVRSVHLMLHSAFERAVKERLIPRNPTDDCIAPKVRKVEMKTLRPEHLKAYLNAADARGVLPIFYLELVSGLRKGELVALLWDDLDVQNKIVSVSKQYIKNPSGKLTLSRPKTETSVRRVSIPQEAVDLPIQEHEKHPKNPYMFPSSEYLF